MKGLFTQRRCYDSRKTTSVRRSLTLFAGLSTMLVLAALLILLVSVGRVTNAEKGGKGKGGGGGGGDPPPPALNVRYRADLIPAPAATDTFVLEMNNLGLVVGHYRADGADSTETNAFMYDYVGDQLYNLNSLPPLNAQLSSLLGDSAWYFRYAIGINDHGDIVGGLRNAITTEENGYVIDTSPDDALGFNPDPATWIVALLPDFQGDLNTNWYSEAGKHINAHGDVLGTYVVDGTQYAYLHNPWQPFMPGTNPLPLTPALWGTAGGVTALNNLGQVALLHRDENGQGVVLLFDPADASYIPFAEELYTSIGGLNNNQVFCGTFETTRFGRRAFRHDTLLVDVITEGGAVAINSDGDVLVEKARRIQDPPSTHLLYTGSSDLPGEQLINIDELVAAGDAVTLWLDNGHYVGPMSERDSTGFSQIAGGVESEGFNHGVVLTPYNP